MKIIKLKISNYRNLDNVFIDFDENCNFIVGENNLGKSNLLELMQIIFTNRSFKADDFFNNEKAIEVEFTLKLDNIEIGHFQDLFDDEKPNQINIICKQESIDDNLEFYHKETNIYIPAVKIRGLNFIYYDSLRNPIQEVNFGKSRGVSRFLNNIVHRYLKENKLENKDFIKEDKLAEVLNYVNKNITRIKIFKDFNIHVIHDKELENLLPKMLVFEDNNENLLSKTGYGVQFLILITLSILEKIEYILNKKNANNIFETEDGKKYISLVIGLDEPEIHLHPYMQRSLIKYLNNILLNQNEDFLKLIKELFGLNGFIGQLILVTHSPNIILNDYSQIIRFYSKENQTKIVSGASIELDEKLTKHLHLLFPFIKEAFFSRGVLLVEGDSEYASFPHFAKTLEYDFDELGISLIQTRGEGGIEPAIKLLNKFSIPAVAIRDRDNIESSQPPIYLTDKRNFEEELVEHNFNSEILEEIFLEYDTQGENRKFQKGALIKKAKNYGLEEPTRDLRYKDISNDIDKKVFFITWYSINKSVTLGLLIGQKLNKDQIPPIYKTIIQKIVEMVSNE